MNSFLTNRIKLNIKIQIKFVDVKSSTVNLFSGLTHGLSNAYMM